MAGGSDSGSADMKAVIVSQLGELAKQIFGKSWEFGPTGLTPPLPERWDFFREFVGNFRQKRVKYAIKTVIYKSWAKFPTVTENLFWGLPLTDLQRNNIFFSDGGHYF